MAILWWLPSLFLIAWVVALVYYAGQCVYNVFLHSLKGYPGPLLGRASLLYSSYYHVIGRYPNLLKNLHAKYGDVVRISPNELSYISSQAWRDIYGSRNPSGETPNFEKDDAAFPRNRKIHTLITAPNEVHGRMRRLASHAFSVKALAAQEPIVISYVSELIDQLRARCQDPTKSVVDMKSWFNFTTFDIISDLMFGDSFHCVKTGTQDPWITFIFNTIKLGALMRVANRLPKIARTTMFFWIYTLVPNDALKNRKKSQERTEERLSKGITDRRDFIDEMLEHNDEKGMTHDEIKASSPNFVIGGSETTATLLSGAVFHLLTNKGSLRKLSNEIRENFKADDDITFNSTIDLKYLNAVLQESLRIYPPVADTLQRLVPEPGHIIDGKFVSSGTIVGVQQYAAYHSSRNFKRPESFVPERWLGDGQYEDDNRKVLQPFSVGPRNCIGQRLAWAEMRVILARLVWNFDLDLLGQSEDWLNQLNRIMWEKPPLYVEVSPRGQ